MTRRPTAAENGSSPLARGLPSTERRIGSLDGIIPARAGFTEEYPDRGHDPGDHPRSRGVYRTRHHSPPMLPGSSPLARGLPYPPSFAAPAAGIIPARAGFTPSPRSPTWRRGDHPRSRGVYGRPPPTATAAWGSSPLARGLLAMAPILAIVRRIIPARAGFTLAPGVRARRLGGSSPLARGLRGPGRRESGGPADHPRSRGVYFRPTTRARLGSGSSPLARGLPPRAPISGPPLRIIPARAGFTRAAPSRATSRSDHPRSRGVYGLTDRILAAARGSSPLARGLLGLGQTRPLGGGIIPARAGFTGWAHRTGAGGSDHPRSRGVYPQSLFELLTDRGSSPLARGLRAQVVGQLGHGGSSPLARGLLRP